jgi:hypothetical protein
MEAKAMSSTETTLLNQEAWEIVERVAQPLLDLTNLKCHIGLVAPIDCSHCRPILQARQLLARRKRLAKGGK